ncbi:MAG: S8 family serine peptidase [Zoogloea sp.]|nr:S8 family serine peptidase [Zoogloea sp.]
MKVRIRTALALGALLGALPCAHALEGVEARVIMKLKAGSPLKQIQAAGRVETLNTRLGLKARMISQPGRDLHVLRANGLTSEALAARLSGDADVEYAVPDRVKKISALPNDPLYGFQWYLQAPDTTRLAATNAQAAWDITSGNGAVVVAVVDSGVRFDHEDLAPRLVAGYDFITDNLNANDAQSGRDADASDPGDYVSTADRNNAALAALCGILSAHGSSWHGTQVAGILAAETNNSRGIAGLAGATRIQPIRVLGKCGGFDSDIIAGMRWAAGLSVPGVPSNPTPARVINLSLAGAGTCSAAYRSAIAEIRAAGALIVAASGNESGAVNEPANCPGVLAVAGIRHAGTKVGYSSHGVEVGISAPAGNCVNIEVGQPCLFPFVTLTNLGTTSPAGNTYTGTGDVTVGTSFAAPLVAGTAALMLAANAALTETDVSRLIKSSATPFPLESTLPTCPLTSTDGQCNCTTTTCGAGMLNTGSAVAAAIAAANPSVSINLAESRVAGMAFKLDASASKATGSAHLVAWKWIQISGPENGQFSSDNIATPSFTAPVAGTYVVGLTVTDDSGRQGTGQATFDVQSAAVKSGGGSGGGALDAGGLFALIGLAALVAGRRLKG